MRVLTVRQPWAWAIAWGGKRVENRSTRWSYRGPVLIHAGAAWSTRGQVDTRVARAWWDGQPDRPWTLDDPLAAPPPLAPAGQVDGVTVHPSMAGDDPARCIDFGVVVAMARLVDVHHDHRCCRPWGESIYTTAAGERRLDVYHLTLANVYPYRSPLYIGGGRLGLWKPPAHIAGEAVTLMEWEQAHPGT